MAERHILRHAEKRVEILSGTADCILAGPIQKVQHGLLTSGDQLGRFGENLKLGAYVPSNQPSFVDPCGAKALILRDRCGCHLGWSGNGETEL